MGRRKAVAVAGRMATLAQCSERGGHPGLCACDPANRRWYRRLRDDATNLALVCRSSSLIAAAAVLACCARRETMPTACSIDCHRLEPTVSVRRGVPEEASRKRENATAHATVEQQGPLVAYLRGVADALAAPTATTDSVVAAGRGRTLEVVGDLAYFRPPDSRFAEARVSRSGSISAPPDRVTLECDTAGPRVHLTELVAAFGPWVLLPPPTTSVPIWHVQFATPYRRPGAAAPGAPEVVIFADLAAHPDDPNAPVLLTSMLRQRIRP